PSRLLPCATELAPAHRAGALCLKELRHETHLSAEQADPQTAARLPVPYGDGGCPQGHRQSPPLGPQAPVGLAGLPWPRPVPGVCLIVGISCGFRPDGAALCPDSCSRPPPLRPKSTGRPCGSASPSAARSATPSNATESVAACARSPGW